VLTAATVALVASGTATLETLLCKRPMVVAYRVGRASAFLLRGLGLLKVAHFAQPNLLAGQRVVPEFAQAEVTPERLGRELGRWLDSPDEVAGLVGRFAAIHRQLRQGASERAAEAILELVRSGAR
jgi:lipid-A-disaccharide synthase